MKNPFKNIYLKNRLFLLLLLVVIAFVVSFWIGFLFFFAQIALCAVVALVLVELLVLFQRKDLITAKRTLADQLSLGDENKVHLHIESHYNTPVFLNIIDEVPYQLQKRDLNFRVTIPAMNQTKIDYTIEPKARGVYKFHNINIFVSTILGLIERRFVIEAENEVGVYPSILQMRKHEFQMFSKSAANQGVKKIRRLGNTNEFEQIKEYVKGDDYRHINWKATSRRAKLMVNQYQDEKSQQIYCVIDKSRNMKMPFEGLSLLDHAINSSLVMSNVALRKGDKAGLITFSDKIGAQLKATRNAVQLRKIMEILYKQKTDFLESNYELLYQSIRRTIKGRSLILLYTNFESMYSLERALPILRKINQHYLIVTIFFENTEISNASEMECADVGDIYLKTFAKKFTSEKEMMVKELRKHGIQSILAKPDNLSVDSINKYLELKSRGMI
jgi:uncharacterized protein (DUF58 family)